MSREPTLADWFETVCVNRAKAKEAVNATPTWDKYPELYEDIVSDADRQLRALSNRFRKLSIYAEKAAEKAKEEANSTTPQLENQEEE